MRSQCLQRNLLLDGEDHQDSNEVEDIKDDNVLEGEYSDGDDQDHLSLITGCLDKPDHDYHLCIVRYGLSLPQ